MIRFCFLASILTWNVYIIRSSQIHRGVPRQRRSHGTGDRRPRPQHPDRSQTGRRHQHRTGGEHVHVQDQRRNEGGGAQGALHARVQRGIDAGAAQSRRQGDRQERPFNSGDCR